MKYIAFVIVLFQIISLQSQTLKTDKEIIQQIADKIIADTKYSITDVGTAVEYPGSSNLATDKEYKISNRYLEWKYWNGVMNIAMIQLAQSTGDNKYKKYAQANYQFFFDNLKFFESLYNKGIKNTGADQFFAMHMLDDCGAMGAGLLDVYQIEQQLRYREYIDKVANFIMVVENRTPNGTLARSGPYNKTLWLDDLYMSVPFIARYGKLTGNDKYFEFAAKQIKQFSQYLYDKNAGIYYHCYFPELKEHGVAHWGRANGWCIMAQVNLLELLPKNHPERDTLIKILRQQIVGLARYQSESGLWHQLLDKPDSYLETSCSAMFTYAIAKAVNEGWLDERFKTIAIEGWKGLKTKIQPDGQVKDICEGTWINNDIVFYYKRPTPLNDIHGLGAVILAGNEILKLCTTQEPLR